MIDGTQRGLDAYAEELGVVVRIDAGHITEVWGNAFHVHLLQQIREHTSDPPP